MKDFLSKFGMLVVLVGLIIVLTVLTWSDQEPTAKNGAQSVATQLAKSVSIDSANIVIIHRAIDDDREFATLLKEQLNSEGIESVDSFEGDIPAARQYILQKVQDEQAITALAVPVAVSRWILFDNLESIDPALANVIVVEPRLTQGSVFLSPSNLKNVFSQIAIVAIMAIGMTMVIISGGIDLSVGSLAAFSAVLSCFLIDKFGGGMEASASSLILFSMLSILACGAVGFFSGYMVTKNHIPPFIMTLAMMLIARGFASILSNGETIQVNESYTWLGTGASFFGIPNTVVLMIILYVLAYIVMNKMRFGRHLYAVGGNLEAAHLSGVSVNRILIIAYTVCGCLAGLGGIILASQFNSGSHTYGVMYELKVIAAVVVGGTSLSGGQGHVLGTLIGALIIAVIGNGMNLMGLDSFVQEVILGFVILAAVWIDNQKK